MSSSLTEKLCHIQQSQLLVIDIQERLRQSGIIISTVESVLFEWLRDAQHTSFKSISALIK